MSIEEIKVKLGRAIAAAGVAKQITAAVTTDSVDTAQLARDALHDSEHPEVKEGLACLKAATDELTLVVRRLDTSVASTSEFQEKLG
ncbi:hypothetical protein ACN27G_01545 [Plantactinospora sp. WMMB334]|uniref:hypothetical protein n=1 Tax=Plantactinospora sp. WMMB334 TaxID=3404119 RepID=UPI003B94BB77